MSDKIVHLGNQDLAATTAAIMESERLTQTAAAREIGLNKSIFNQWLKGRYPGDNRAVAAKVQRWLDARQAKEQVQQTLPEAPTWVDTPTSRSILTALSFSQMASSITVIYGGAGTGKTTALARYRDQAPNVWVVTATPATARPGPLLYRIAQTLGLRPTGAAHQLEGAIIDRLIGTNGLLIIDEAQHLSLRALDAVRSIHDAAGIGLAFSGNEIIYAQMTGGRRSVGFAQLFSRVGKRVRLDHPQIADIDALLDAWQIADREARQFCHRIGRRPGALRGLSQTLRIASMFAAGATPQAEHIKAAWLDLGGD